MSASSKVALDPNRLPRHVGIIMDGNGRWAEVHGRRRSQGHREGLEAAKRIVRAASEIKLPFLSLYAFSTENWRRQPSEIKYLMGLVLKNLRKEYDFYKENNVRLVHSGNIEGLPENVRREIELVQSDTMEFNGTIVNLALNYGGRDEIIRAVNRWLADGKDTRSGAAHGVSAHDSTNGAAVVAKTAATATPAGNRASRSARNGYSSPAPHISEETLQAHLDLPYFPPPDLIVRTAGEKRLSNFLLWECAYSELVFSERLWPDWNGDDLREAVAEYQNRSRRFGGR